MIHPYMIKATRFINYSNVYKIQQLNGNHYEKKDTSMIHHSVFLSCLFGRIQMFSEEAKQSCN